jgi:cytochrome c
MKHLIKKYWAFNKKTNSKSIKNNMKPIIGTLLLVLFITACGNHANEGNANGNEKAADPNYNKGMELIANSNCLSCHKLKEKAIGPAYQDIANKYENNDANVKMLANKIIYGGTGNWGNIAMSPHSEISQENAEAMVKYILLLRK